MTQHARHTHARASGARHAARLRSRSIAAATLLLPVIVGLLVGALTETPSGAASLKPPVRGLVDRAHYSSSSFVSGFVVNARWADIQPAKGGAIVHPNAIDTAINQAQTTGKTFKIRVTAGVDSPGWLKTATGGAVTLYAPGSGTLAGTAPRWWTPAMNTAYDDLQAKLAATYDSSPYVQEVTVDECMGVFAEPYLKDASDSRNVANLRSAGYTDTADRSCLSHEIVAHQVWQFTRSNLSFNAYQDITSTRVKPDMTFTLAQMSYCRQVLGPRCVLSNHSLSSSRISDPQFSQIYDKMKASGPPTDFQTATAAKIGDWTTVLSYALSVGANNVELPAGYTNWSSSTLTTYDQKIAANAVDAGSGTSSDPNATTSPTPTPSSTSPTPTPSSTSTTPPPSGAVTKTVVIWEENNSYKSIYGNSEMPYLNSLANTYGRAGVAECCSPSLPNYLNQVYGSSFGITDDKPPSAHTVPGPSIYDQVPNALAFAESMPSNCYKGNGTQTDSNGNGWYATRHNPWTYENTATKCSTNDRPFTQSNPANLVNAVNAGLPRFTSITPAICNDLHKGTCQFASGQDYYTRADAWLKKIVPLIQAGPDWKAGNLAIWIAFDEGGADPTTLATIAAPGLHNKDAGNNWTQTQMLATWQDVAGVGRIRGTVGATSLKAALGL
jgi:hypothetical protein